MFRVSTRFACSWLVVMVVVSACARDADATKQEYLRNGDRLFDEGNFAAAIVEYRNAVREDERFGQARFKLGQAYLRNGETGAARAQLVRAADLLPTDVEAQLAAGRILLQAGEYEDARTRAELALKLNPGHVDAYLIRGGAFAGERAFDDAVKAFEDGLAIDPARRELHTNLGAVKTVQAPAEAEASFRQAVVVAPKSVEARVALAHFYWSAGKLEEAEKAYRDALQVEDGVTANRALAVFYMGTNRQRDAEAPFRKAAELSKDPRAIIVLADYFVSQRRFNDALPILDALANQPGAYAAVTARRAAIEYELGRRDAAYALLDEVFKKNPRDADALVTKARWLLLEKKASDALAAAQQAVTLEPQAWDAHESVGAAHAAQRSHDEAFTAYSEAVRLNPRAADSLLALSELSLLRGNTEAAVRLAEDARRNRPTSGRTQFALVRALVAHRSYQRARAELAPLLKAMPDATPTQLLVAQISLAEGDRQAARMAFERALASDPTSTEAVDALVRMDAVAKQPARGVERASKLVSLLPNVAEPHYIAARAYLAANNLADSEKSLRRAMAIDPSYIPAYLLLAEVYVRQHKLGDAQQEFERILTQRRDDVSAHTMIGILLEAQQKTTDAQKAYQRVLDIDSRAPVAANNLAYIYADQGSNLDIALSLAQTAKAARPDDPDVNDTLGWVYYKRDLPSLAKAPLEQSVRTNPAHPLYQLHLGLVYAKLGETANARTALERAAATPNFYKVAEAKKALAELQ
jgi:tetratricopeptide (TPR) repeat protein